jgi:hypothetical protein
MTRSPSGCLVIIFNHPYPSNIAKLKQIYARRFARVVFLLPLEEMNDPDVYTVYRGSYSFQGFIADAQQFLSSIDADFFVFAGDDLLINPNFDERKIYDRLRVDKFDGYIPQFRSLSLQSVKIGDGVDASGTNWGGDGRGLWFWTERVLSRIYPQKPGLFGAGCESAWRYLPARKEALDKFAAFGINTLVSPKARPASSPVRQYASRVLHSIKSKLRGNTDPWQQQDLPYPLAYGISDFFVVRRDALTRFSRYCGVLAALDIFVEAAIPTALLLACDQLGTGSDTSLRCKWTFTPSNVSNGAQTTLDYASICREFEDDLLFIHPVKFSQMKM